MNIKKIPLKIKYYEYEELNEYDFCNTACKNNLFSNFEFINYFKNNGKSFWRNVILFTNLSISLIFKKYSNYLIDKNFAEGLNKILEYTYTMNPPFSDEYRMQVIKNIKQYQKCLNKFSIKKYNKIIYTY